MRVHVSEYFHGNTQQTYYTAIKMVQCMYTCIPLYYVNDSLQHHAEELLGMWVEGDLRWREEDTHHKQWYS